MKSSLFPVLITLLAALGLSSCSNVQSRMKNTAQRISTPLKNTVSRVSSPLKNGVQKVSAPLKNGMQRVSTPFKNGAEKISNLKSLAQAKTQGFKGFNFFRKKGVTPPVIDVRNQEFVAAQAKKSRAVAVNQKKTKYKKASAPTLPEDFDPSDLTVDGQLPAHGILPSLNPGNSSSTEVTISESDLPPHFSPIVPDLPTQISPVIDAFSADIMSVPDPTKSQ